MAGNLLAELVTGYQRNRVANW